MLTQDDLVQLGQAPNPARFTRSLINAADKLGFPLISAILVLEHPTADATLVSVGNTPDGYAEVYANATRTRRCPVMTRLRNHGRPFIYDRAMFESDGVPELWEEQAPFGYKCGVALATHMPERRHFLLGVDREESLPTNTDALIGIMSAMTLLASFAQEAAVRVLTPETQPETNIPRLTPRELEVLKWARDGKSANVTADLLSISERTVNYWIASAMAKLNVCTKGAAVVKAMRLNLL